MPPRESSLVHTQMRLEDFLVVSDSSGPSSYAIRGAFWRSSRDHPAVNRICLLAISTPKIVISLRLSDGHLSPLVGSVTQMQEIRHLYTTIDNVEVFYRNAGSPEAPTVLLLHGFPSSSFQFRHMLAALSDEWHLVAPDLPGFGFTKVGTQKPYAYTFDGLADTTARWIEKLDLTIAATYLHDYGGHVGFRLIARNVINPQALIIQNTEAYLGDGWRDPMRGIEARQTESPDKGRARLQSTLINEAGIWKEFFEDLPADIAERIDPAAFQLGWSKICSPGVLEAMLDLHMDYASNIRFYEQIQAHFRNKQTPTLLLWGEHDQYLSIDAAQAYKRDLPKAQLVKLGGGHWLLESHLCEVNEAVRSFLSSTI